MIATVGRASVVAGALLSAAAAEYTFHSPPLGSPPFSLGPGETVFSLPVTLFDKTAPAHDDTPVLKRVTVVIEVAFGADFNFYNSGGGSVDVGYELSGAGIIATAVGDELNHGLSPLTALPPKPSPAPPPTTPPLALAGTEMGIAPNVPRSVHREATPTPALSLTSTDVNTLARYSAGSAPIAYDVDFTALYPQIVSTTPVGFLCMVSSDRVTGRLKVIYEADPLAPTAVDLISFAGQWSSADAIRLDWKTGLEVNSVGFHLDRWMGGSWSRVTPEIVLAEGGSAPQDYSFTDAPVPSVADVRYRLLEVDRKGATNLLGETVVVMGPRTGIEVDGATLTLTVQGQPNSTVAVDTATDVALGPWILVDSVTLDAQGRARIPVALGAVEPTRFFRLRQL